MKSQNQIVAICVARNVANDEDEYEGYVINDSLFEIISQCPDPYNDAFDLVEYPDTATSLVKDV